MIRKIIAVVFIIIMIVVLMKILIRTERGRCKADIVSLRKAVENEERSKAMGFIAASYHDKNDMTYDMLIDNIDRLFADFDTIEVNMHKLKIYIDSTDANNHIYAHCSLGIKIFAHYEGDRTLIFGGLVRSNPVKAWLKKSNGYYQVYDADY